MPRPSSPYASMGFPRTANNAQGRPLASATGSSATYPLANPSVKPLPSTPPPRDYTPPNYMPLVPGGMDAEGPPHPDNTFAPFFNALPTDPQPTAPLPAGTVFPPSAQPAATPVAPPQTAPVSSGPQVGQTMNNGNGLIYTWNGTDWKPDQAAFTKYQQQQAAQFGAPASPPANPYGGFQGIVNATQSGLGNIANQLTQLADTANANTITAKEPPPNRPFPRTPPPPSPPPPFPMTPPWAHNTRSLAGR